MLARELRSGDEVIVDGIYCDVVYATPVDGRIKVVLNMQYLAPRNPRTGEKVDWTHYESILRPSARVRARRAS